MDLVIRNARLPQSPENPPVDIGIENGKIVAIEDNITVDAPHYDAHDHLVCAGLVETHIHLDKTRIIDRCPPEDGRNANAVPRVAAVKHLPNTTTELSKAIFTVRKYISPLGLPPIGRGIRRITTYSFTTFLTTTSSPTVILT